VLNEALQALIDNGIDRNVYDSVVRDLARKDHFDTEDDKRWFIAYNFTRNEVKDIEPDECVDLNGNAKQFGCDGEEYILVNNDEANALCGEYILETLWAFRPKYLAEITGMDKTIFEVLQPQCENANEAIHAIIKNTCGIDYFIENTVKTDGRGIFLAIYDGEEREYEFNGKQYYLYRVN